MFNSEVCPLFYSPWLLSCPLDATLTLPMSPIVAGSPYTWSYPPTSTVHSILLLTGSLNLPTSFLQPESLKNTAREQVPILNCLAVRWLFLLLRICWFYGRNSAGFNSNWIWRLLPQSVCSIHQMLVLKNSQIVHILHSQASCIRPPSVPFQESLGQADLACMHFIDNVTHS